MSEHDAHRLLCSVATGSHTPTGGVLFSVSSEATEPTGGFRMEFVTHDHINRGNETYAYLSRQTTLPLPFASTHFPSQGGQKAELVYSTQWHTHLICIMT